MIFFHKMHGCGNDFVILDARNQTVELSADRIRMLADRNRGIGCDQLIIYRDPKIRRNGLVAVEYFNSDGSNGDFCGNATLCLGHLLGDELDRSSIDFETRNGIVTTERMSDQLYKLKTPEPSFDWRNIPLARECDTLDLPLAKNNLMASAICAVGMGNPHCVIFTNDCDRDQWADRCPDIEHDSLFPKHTNVSLIIVKDRNTLDVRVWERGAGFTQACGSASLACAAAAMRLDKCDSRVDVVLPGGTLQIEWPDQKGPISMSGPTRYVFSGTIDHLALREN